MREKINIHIQTKFQFYCYCFLALIRNAHSVSSPAQLMSFCNQQLNMPSPSLSIIHIPSTSYSSCCNVTLTSDSNDQITFQLKNLSVNHPALRISNKQLQSTGDMMDLPILISLCQLDLPTFEILLTKSNTKTIQPVKIERKIRGGIVTTIMVFGSLLIIASVSIALGFVYIRRRNLRRRQLTASLESTSDDWEPSGTGYRLFDNWTHNRRHTDNQIDNLHIDANEHMPITTNMTIR